MSQLSEAAERVLKYVNVGIDQFTRDVRLLADAALASQTPTPPAVTDARSGEFVSSVMDSAKAPTIADRVDAAQKSGIITLTQGTVSEDNPDLCTPSSNSAFPPTPNCSRRSSC
jgi:hypothetical protein